ncbi:MAG: MFS transporter [bacterium]|nr:MFS transporter [bacterium]
MAEKQQLSDSQSEPELKKQRHKLFAIGAIGTFMATLDGSILNVALPTIAGELNAPIDRVAWVVLAYSLTLVSLMMVFGAWGGRKGYRFAYSFGFLFFTAGSITCVSAANLPILLVGRVVQAIGAAMFAAIGPGMITQVFPSKERGQAIGMMVMMVAVGLMTGPPLGGFLLSFWSWPSIFVINIPIGVVGFWLVQRYFGQMPLSVVQKKMHYGGAISLALAMLCGMLFLSLLNDFALSDPIMWLIALVAVISALLFFRFESRPETALIGMEIFRIKQFRTSIIAMTTMFIAMSGTLVIGPFYLEHIKKFEPQSVGFFLMILPVTMMFMAPLAGRVSDRIGFRLLTTVGTIILSIGLFLISRFQPESSTTYIASSLLVLGVGIGIFNTPNSSALMGSVSAEQRAVASGILGTARNVGMSFGIALATGLFAWFQEYYLGRYEETVAFVAAYNRVALIAIGVALIGIPFCLSRKNRLES